MAFDRRRVLALLGAAGAAGLEFVGEATAQQAPSPGLHQIGSGVRYILGSADITLAPRPDGGFSSLALRSGRLYSTPFDARLNAGTQQELVRGDRFFGCAEPIFVEGGVMLMAALRKSASVQGQVVLYRLPAAGSPIGPATPVSLEEPLAEGHCRMVALGGGDLLIAWQAGGFGNLQNVRYRIVGQTGELRSPVLSIKRKSGRAPHVLAAVVALADGRGAIAFRRDAAAFAPVLIQTIDALGAPVGDPFQLGEGNVALAALPDGGVTAVWGRPRPVDLSEQSTMCVQYRKGAGQFGPLLETPIDLNAVAGASVDRTGFHLARAADGRLVVAVGGRDYDRNGEGRTAVLLFLLTGKGRQIGKPIVLANYLDGEEVYKARSLVSLTNASFVVGWTEEVYYRGVGATTLHRFRLV